MAAQAGAQQFGRPPMGGFPGGPGKSECLSSLCIVHVMCLTLSMSIHVYMYSGMLPPPRGMPPGPPGMPPFGGPPPRGFPGK